MKQVVRLTSTYSADLFGISSVLYELGGLVVMHDASGCNSTYNTHDEPRWYDIESMVYISGLVENDVILGNDNKLIEDICEAADETHPKFIAISAAMIAHFMSVDIRGIAKIIEKRTGIPTFAFDTNAMDTYIAGGNMAYRALVERFCEPKSSVSERANGEKLKVNLLGITPLDFSIVGNVEELQDLLSVNNIEINSCMTMGCTIEDIQHAADADVNLLCSSIAEDAAKLLEKKFGTPYVTGLPMGHAGTEAWLCAIRDAAENGQSVTLFGNNEREDDTWDNATVIIGEPVFASSLRYCLEQDFGIHDIHIICPMERTLGLLAGGDIHSKQEDILEELLPQASLVIADPIYRRILGHGSEVQFVNLPHEAYSGRMYRSHIPVFIGPDFDEWLAGAMCGDGDIDTNDIMKANKPFTQRLRY